VRTVEELVELGEITDEQESEVVAGEHAAWGGVGEELEWAEKQRHVALRSADGGLVAIAGALVAQVEVEGTERFEVLGIGGVMVTASERGRGLVWRLLEPLLEIAAEMGPQRAMLFCRPQLTALYEKFAFAEITAPVWARQPEGKIEMPLCAMWRPLRAGVRWPEGRVEVQGLPF
jgi:predicted GNAT family N-acyltransferase